MPVLWITVILSLLLALVFLVLFVKEHRRFDFGSSERISLLPLEEDAKHAATPPEPPAPAQPTRPADRSSTPPTPPRSS